MNKTFHPLAVQKIGSELAISWSDGPESFLPIERLRRSCPCARCGGEPDVMGHVERPQVTYGDRSFELMGWQTVGGYALQMHWGDGHNTGLYAYSYLRRLAETARE